MFVLLSDRVDFCQRWQSLLRGASLVCHASIEAISLQQWHAPPYLMIIDVHGVGAHLLPPGQLLHELTRHGKVLLGDCDIDVDTELASLSCGVSGCCSSSLSNTELETVVDVILKGGIWVSKAALPSMLVRLKNLVSSPLGSQQNLAGAPRLAAPVAFHSEWDKLTPREKTIAEQVAQGASNKEIARKLSVSDATIKAHLTSVFQKLHVPGRTQLALLLSQHLQPHFTSAR
jgi:DNA-binding NarL/FixJ family response regulator